MKEFEELNLLPYDIKNLIAMLQAKLKKEVCEKNTISNVINEEKKVLCCPHCQSVNIVKNGHTKTGLQTYKCKDCNKRFNSLTNTIFHHTHLSYEQITRFFECMRDKFSVRKTAQIVGITPTSAFNIRHKILDTLKEIRNNIKLHGKIEADEYYISINLKGTNKYKMPRASKPRKTKGTGTRGISSHKVCIETAIDEFDNLFLEISGTGQVTSDMIKKSLVSKTKNVTKIITDCKSSYESIAKDNNWNLIQIKSGTYVSENGDSLANVNGLHSELEKFISHFHGVSTNHLQSYLDWLMFDKYINYTVEILKQAHEFEITTITKNSLLSYSNIYSNYSGLNYEEIYKDYNYHAISST